MKLRRLFLADGYKGTKKYLDTQKKYELTRTILYFGISLSLFIAGYMVTKSKVNVLTIVAVLGCLPASKSLVSTIMFFKFKSCSLEDMDTIEACNTDLVCLYDLAFTTYQRNYLISHVTIRGNTIAAYTTNNMLDENACIKHLSDSLALDGITGVTIKIFKDVKKYTQRMEQLQSLPSEELLEGAISTLFCSISL